LSLVEVEQEGRVAALVLNRPDARNALSAQMCNEVVEALERIDASDARVVIVRGNGKVFCAGADFAAVSGPGGLEFLPAFERMLEGVSRFRLPTIAAIHGAALGGGLQLATVCDFRLASIDAKLGIPSSKLGILVNFENVQRLVLLAGTAVAKEVLIAGRTYSGEAAVAAGLVNASADPDVLAGVVAKWAGDIAQLAPLSVQGAKKAIQTVVDHLGGARRSDPEAVARIDQLVAEAYSSADLQEGLSALAEKRPPDFTWT
jgi:enoyl-CoA hydratase/carnithine racemase